MAEFKCYLVSYNFDGSLWNVEMPARSLEEARERVAALRFAKVDGELMATIPASVGFLAPLIVWLRNLFGRV